MKVLTAGLVQLHWFGGGRNQAGNWGLILSTLMIRDLKVSNLLMTDKGCVKIGESPAPAQPAAAPTSVGQAGIFTFISTILP